MPSFLNITISLICYAVAIHLFSVSENYDDHDDGAY